MKMADICRKTRRRTAFSVHGSRVMTSRYLSNFISSSDRIRNSWVAWTPPLLHGRVFGQNRSWQWTARFQSTDCCHVLSRLTNLVVKVIKIWYFKLSASCSLAKPTQTERHQLKLYDTQQQQSNGCQNQMFTCTQANWSPRTNIKDCPWT